MFHCGLCRKDRHVKSYLIGLDFQHSSFSYPFRSPLLIHPPCPPLNTLTHVEQLDIDLNMSSNKLTSLLCFDEFFNFYWIDQMAIELLWRFRSSRWHFINIHQRCSTCPLVFGCWKLSHVIFLMLRKKELIAKLSKSTQNDFLGPLSENSCHFVNLLSPKPAQISDIFDRNLYILLSCALG